MEHTNTSALLTAIRAERARLVRVIEDVPPDRLALPGAVGEWSVKDVLAHLAAWTARAVTLLFQAERGKPPSYGVKESDGWVDRLNAQDYAGQKDRPIERILADFHGAHAQLIKRLEAWRDERALFDAARYASLGGASLAEHVWSNSAEHDREHREHIEVWMRSHAGV